MKYAQTGESMLAEKKMCMACGACFSVCKFSAIEMIRDNNGFLFPQVLSEKCTECGQCEAVCPLLTDLTKARGIKYYFGWHQDETVREKSTSGGVMSAITEVYANCGYVVYGAVWNEAERAVQMRSAEEINYIKQRKSKYVEAEVGESFKTVEQLLENGRQVIYCGTPCQISGLKNFLGEKENIIYVDFICNGVPSSGEFQRHMIELENKYGSPIVDVHFRSKMLGWADYVMEITLKNGKKKHMPASRDTFFNGFQKGIILRENCYQCIFREGHVSDITIADFWGINEFDKSLNDDKGISLICVNSDKGEKVIEQIKDKMFIKELPEKYAEYVYKDVFEDGEKLQRRGEFYMAADELGFEKAAHKLYMKGKISGNVKYVIKKMLRLCGVKYR